ADAQLSSGRSRRKACLARTLAHRFLVVDDETEVPVVVRPLPAALRERDELVAEIDERHAAHPTAQLHVAEESLPERERLVEVAALERDVVDADRMSHRNLSVSRGV